MFNILFLFLKHVILKIVEYINMHLNKEKLMKTPYYIFKIDDLNHNLSNVRILQNETGCNVLYSLKGLSAPWFLNLLKNSHVFCGFSAGSLYEFNLGKRFFDGYRFIYSPAYDNNFIDESISLSSHIIFNNMTQLNTFYNRINCKNIGIRVKIDKNFMLTGVPKHDYFNSRFGVNIDEIDNNILDKINGILIHCMCEQYSDALEKLLNYLSDNYSHLLRHLKWINLGGGQMIGSNNYDLKRAIAALKYFKSLYNLDIFLEPSEGIITQTMDLIVSVLDIGNSYVIVNASSICNFPDSLTGWKRDIHEKNLPSNKFKYSIYGNSCNLNDKFGDYTFKSPINIGDTIVFKDVAAYSLVKSNYFNGIAKPDIYKFSNENGFKLIKKDEFSDYYRQL